MRLTTVADGGGVVRWKALTRLHLRPTAPRHGGERWVIPPILKRCSAFSVKGLRLCSQWRSPKATLSTARGACRCS